MGRFESKSSLTGTAYLEVWQVTPQFPRYVLPLFDRCGYEIYCQVLDFAHQKMPQGINFRLFEQIPPPSVSRGKIKTMPKPVYFFSLAGLY